ncbi:STAS domain-containing protein [Neobacillus notoginsengisoli]|uniref:STAS domain-containing protein n=1 Tax=Neobacillus notoginsengisoli TaxID=1578198 RepID=A0A417YWA1_9BACI|nr:STAS domain-containing protein [Neobacillus notoginsengisoli]RHW41662.1 STAS domain-containing protein [Neobacillus notoginsengisoli]
MSKNSEIQILRDKNRELMERVNELESLVRTVSVPIIPSILPGVILVPLAGEISPQRFDLIIPKILSHAGSKDVDSVILDFSAISMEEIGDLNILGHYLINLTSSLRLVGVQAIVVGIHPQFAQELVMSQVSFIKELKTFSTFKAALQSLMKDKGLSLVEISRESQNHTLA